MDKLLKPALILSMIAALFAALFAVWCIGRFTEIQQGLNILASRWADIRQVRSVSIASGGVQVQLRSTIIFRIPEPPSATSQPSQTNAKFDELNEWLTSKLGGWSRWHVESQSFVASDIHAPSKCWMYLVSIEEGQKEDPAQLIEHKIAELFPDAHPILIVSLPHNPFPSTAPSN